MHKMASHLIFVATEVFEINPIIRIREDRHLNRQCQSIYRRQDIYIDQLIYNKIHLGV